jgi:hypothetical protein
MHARLLTLPIVCATLLGGCALRWHPQTGPGPATFGPACPGRRAPAVADFGAAGIRGAYHFVIDHASRGDLGALVRGAGAQGFGLAPLTVNINGHDTVFAIGPAVLHDQAEVDAEFQIACRLGRGRIYLTHVRYNPADSHSPEVRVR